LSQTIATWVQAFASVVSLGLTFYLIFYARKGWEAASKNADAARESANVARDALHLTEGADIHLDRLASAQPRFAADTRITLVFKNYGRTRATAIGISPSSIWCRQSRAAYWAPRGPAVSSAGPRGRGTRSGPSARIDQQNSLDTFSRET